MEILSKKQIQSKDIETDLDLFLHKLSTLIDNNFLCSIYTDCLNEDGKIRLIDNLILTFEDLPEVGDYYPTIEIPLVCGYHNNVYMYYSIIASFIKAYADTPTTGD